MSSKAKLGKARSVRRKNEDFEGISTLNLTMKEAARVFHSQKNSKKMISQTRLLSQTLIKKVQV